MGLFDKTPDKMNRSTGEVDPKLLGLAEMDREGIRPEDMPGSNPKERVLNYYAEGVRRGQLIKESRDPKLEREKQLKAREASLSKADEVLKKEGPNPQDFWASEPGLSKKYFIERTGEKIAIPEESRVKAVSREIETPDGGAVSQIAGLYGYGSTKLSPEGVAKLQAQRDREFTFASNVERAKRLRAEREKAAGATSTAKREQWELDKQAYATGQELQRESKRALTRINRALRGGSYYARKPSESGPISASEWQDLMDQKAALEANIAARETLNKKGITELGRKEIANRRMKAEQAREVSKAEYERAIGAERGISEIQASEQLISPYLPIINDTYKYLFTNIDGAFGVK